MSSRWLLRVLTRRHAPVGHASTGLPLKQYGRRDTASFGLDFGAIYKRSVIGVRVFGVPSIEKEALVAYFKLKEYEADLLKTAVEAMKLSIPEQEVLAMTGAR